MSSYKIEKEIQAEGEQWVLRFDGVYLCGNVDKAHCEAFRTRHAAHRLRKSEQMAVQRVCKIDKVAISMPFELANFLHEQSKLGLFEVPASIIEQLEPVSLEYIENDLKAWYGGSHAGDHQEAIEALVKVAVHCIMFDQDPKLIEC